MIGFENIYWTLNVNPKKPFDGVKVKKKSTTIPAFMNGLMFEFKMKLFQFSNSENINTKNPKNSNPKRIHLDTYVRSSDRLINGRGMK